MPGLCDVSDHRTDTEGGATIAQVLQRHEVKNLFTLCGGHISPILVGAKSVKSLANLDATVERAFSVANSGTPGPAFIEVPVDLLWLSAVRHWSTIEIRRRLPARPVATASPYLC